MGKSQTVVIRHESLLSYSNQIAKYFGKTKFNTCLFAFLWDILLETKSTKYLRTIWKVASSIWCSYGRESRRNGSLQSQNLKGRGENSKSSIPKTNNLIGKSNRAVECLVWPLRCHQAQFSPRKMWIPIVISLNDLNQRLLSLGSDRRPEDVSTSFEHQFDDPDDKFNSAGDQVDTQVLKIGGLGWFCVWLPSSYKVGVRKFDLRQGFRKISNRNSSEVRKKLIRPRWTMYEGLCKFVVCQEQYPEIAQQTRKTRAVTYFLLGSSSCSACHGWMLSEWNEEPE